MKKNIYFLFIALLLLICSCGKNNFDISEEKKDFFIYDEGDIFKFRILPNSDTVEFSVLNRKLYYVEQAAIITPETHYFQTLELTVKSDLGHKGSMNVYIDGIEIAIFRNDNIPVFFGNISDTLHNYRLDNHQFLELYVFTDNNDKNHKLYLTKDKGIVYIDRTVSGNSYSLIEYIKSE